MRYEEWKTFITEDLIYNNILFIGDGYRAKNSELTTSGLPFARVGNINGGFNFESCDFFPEKDLKKAGNKISEECDIVFTSKGTVGRFAFVKKDTPRFVYSPQLCFWRIVDKNTIDPGFLFYWMQSNEFKEQSDSVKGQTDMADYVSLTDQRRMKISLPPLPTQRRIASILTTLDDKIELNRRMNETLEGMAQAVWGEWFGKYVSGEKSNLRTLGDYISIKHGYAFKGEYISDVECANILITPGNFSIGGGFNEKKLKYFQADNFPKEYILNPKDLVLTMTDLSRDGDTLGYPAFVPDITGKKLLHNQRIGLVEFKRKELRKHFLYQLMKTVDYRSFILGGATGSTVRHTSPSRICEFKFPDWDNNKSMEFELVAERLDNLVQINLHQSRTLTALRDTLLPRLMRGEMEV